LVCHGEFLIKALLVRGLERIFSFFPSLSAIPRELIQHSDFLADFTPTRTVGIACHRLHDAICGGGSILGLVLPPRQDEFPCQRLWIAERSIANRTYIENQDMNRLKKNYRLVTIE